MKEKVIWRAFQKNLYYLNSLNEPSPYIVHLLACVILTHWGDYDCNFGNSAWEGFACNFMFT